MPVWGLLGRLDYIVRNHFTEQQFVDLDLMKKVSDGGAENEALLRRFWGGYTQGGLTQLTTRFLEAIQKFIRRRFTTPGMASPASIEEWLR